MMRHWLYGLFVVLVLGGCGNYPSLTKDFPPPPDANTRQDIIDRVTNNEPSNEPS